MICWSLLSSIRMTTSITPINTNYLKLLASLLQPHLVLLFCFSLAWSVLIKPQDFRIMSLYMLFCIVDYVAGQFDCSMKFTCFFWQFYEDWSTEVLQYFTIYHFSNLINLQRLSASVIITAAAALFLFILACAKLTPDYNTFIHFFLYWSISALLSKRISVIYSSHCCSYFLWQFHENWSTKVLQYFTTVLYFIYLSINFINHQII